MKYLEICEKVKSGEITLDFCGHRTYLKPEEFLTQYEETLARSLGSLDGKWNYDHKENPAEVDARMRKHFAFKLDEEIEEGDAILSNATERTRCDGCGRKYNWVLNGNKLQLRNYYDYDIGDLVIAPEGERCVLEFQRPTKGQIKVNDTLIFTNRFDFEDEPEGWEKEYHYDWDINHDIGVENVTKFKCEQQNIAYGQMSNMSVGIYVNEDKTKIIVGPGCHPAEYEEYETEKEYRLALSKPVFEGYKFRGSISLGVWRWEASDLKTIGGQDAVKKLKKEHMDVVPVVVPKGIWEFEHFFHLKGFGEEATLHRNKYIYSTLKLKS